MQTLTSFLLSWQSYMKLIIPVKVPNFYQFAMLHLSHVLFHVLDTSQKNNFLRYGKMPCHIKVTEQNFMFLFPLFVYRRKAQIKKHLVKAISILYKESTKYKSRNLSSISGGGTEGRGERARRSILSVWLSCSSNINLT